MALFAVYARKDVTAVQSVMAEDIIWRISGHHPLAGPKHGIQEVMAFFDQLARADFKAQLYRKHIYPHLVSMLGNPKPIRKVRQRIVPWLTKKSSISA
jgi:hypothetical protein